MAVDSPRMEDLRSDPDDGERVPAAADLGSPSWVDIIPPFLGSSGPVMFTTKDSGQRQEYDSGMVRDIQDGKPRFDLLLAEGVPYEAQFLTRIAGLMLRGKEKYGERNWEKASSREEMDRFKASAMRHMLQWMCGESDEDHMAAVAFNLLAYETTKWKTENS